MEYITLNNPLGQLLIDEFKKKNIPLRTVQSGPWKGMLSLEFTQEELDSITELVIENPSRGVLDGIEHLHNLERLTINSYGRTDYRDSAFSITDKDVKIISELSNLKFLSISNQKDISWLYLDNLVNLEELVINNNNSLEEISGLDKLHKIVSFEERGNKVLYSLDHIGDLITNNVDKLDLFEVDLLHFPDLIPYQQLLNSIINIAFVENCEPGARKISYSIGEARLFHKRCLDIASEINNFSVDGLRNIVALEKYLAENITYDYEGLVHPDRRLIIDGKNKGKKLGTNSAYNGIMYGSAVCEGYTRSMQYILRLMGISSKNVECLSGENKIVEDESHHGKYVLPDDGYHSIIRLNYGGDVYYCDPCWDSCHWHEGDHTLPYTLLTTDEISKNHTLSFGERGITAGVIYPRRNVENVLALFNDEPVKGRTK